MPVLGPNDFRTQHTGLLLAQTGSSASQTVAPGASSDQVASIPSDDPCTASLTKAFDDKLVVDSPADVLVSFIEDYCVDAADEYLPSKFSDPAFLSFLVVFLLLLRQGPIIFTGFFLTVDS